MDDRYDPPSIFAKAMGQLHDLVAREVGTTDFGESDYLPGLQVVLQSLDYDPIFSDRGRRIAWGEVVGALSARAHAIKSMAENPGFDGHAILSPIVITGVPRTGTTALHKLMAVDPQFQGLQTWLSSTPMPRPPRNSWEDNPHFRREVERLNQRYSAAPNKRAAHNVVAEEVDECCLILRQSFVSNLWCSAWSSATYDAWWQCQSELPAYQYFYRCLQLIGSTEPEKRWLLKNPGHIANLDLVFAIFPDAKVIITHRDPAKAIPSLCAMLMQLHPIMEEGRTEQHAHNMLTRETAKWAQAIRRVQSVRQAYPNQVLDIVHSDFHRDPMAVIERIYAFADLKLTPSVTDDITERIAEKPELSHGTHRYDVADYGLSENEIRARFGDYVDQFGLMPS